MLIILIMFGIVLTTAIIGIICSKKCYDEAAIGSFTISTVIMGVLIVALIITLVNNGTVEADTLKLKNRYDTIYYQVSNNMYNNDNEIGKKELIDQIMEWNGDIITRKLYSKSIWLNWFYPIDYDQFELIPLEMIH